MWSPQNRHFCAKSIKNSQKQVKNGSFSAVFWSKWRDSNSRPPVPETGALPTALHLVLMIFMRFSVSGQTCGQTEDLRNFRQSGVPKKSVFSRGFSVFQKINFEIGGLHPKLARYHLRYASKICVVIVVVSLLCYEVYNISIISQVGCFVNYIL